ncbi:ribonuclease 3-like isoform X3 [Halichondria panicea]|uniref:ribonuclease 3-like isoform X3 n=1 Tax=Halichondria panicea TaxID=6063 RepID=UPI00312BADA1
MATRDRSSRNRSRDGGPSDSHDRKRPHPPSSPERRKFHRHHSPTRKYSRRSGHSRGHEGDQSDRRRRTLTPPTLLSVDEVVPSFGSASYTGSHGNSDNWKMGDLVICSLNELYYTQKTVEGVSILGPTHQLDELHKTFRMSLLTPSHPHTTPTPTIEATSNDNPTITEAEVHQEKDCDGASLLTEESEVHQEKDCDGAGLPTEERIVDPNIPYNTVNETPSVPVCPISTGPWYTYSMSVSPDTNFKTGLTTITSDTGRLYKFRGFLLLTHTPLPSGLPVCRFQRYSGIHQLELSPLTTQIVFTMEDVLLFNEYLLMRLLELYDLVRELRPLLGEGGFLPLFISDSGVSQEVLSMAEVLKFLLDSYQPLSVKGQSLKGQLITDFNRRPHCFRADDTHHIKSGEGKFKVGHQCRQCSRTKGHKHQRRLTRTEHFNFVELRQQMESHEADTGGTRGQQEVLWLPSDGFNSTGLYTDIVQHVLLLSTLGHHLVFHRSLATLQKSLGYTFTDHTLLHRALTHPSTTTLTHQPAEDNIKTVLSNCGLLQPVYVGGAGPTVAKGLKGLMNSLEGGDKGVWLEHYEQLEFLGDAVLEYITSMRLYHMAPPYSVGQLNHERQLLIKNTRLWQLASRLGLTDYMLVNRKVEGCQEHAGANCLEALLGAVYLDSGDVEQVDQLFARLAFPEQEGFERWTKQSKHPLKEEHPDGDRHLVQQSEELQSIVGLEEKLRLEFTHVRLLARAFTHSSHPDNDIIRGNYQRLEFLGDAILQFLVSKHVYHHFPSHHEGHLTTLRIALVHNKHLASLCKDLGFDQYIITSKTEKLDLSVKLQADVVESFLAALTLDKGLSETEKFLEEYLFPKLLETVRGSQMVDANTRLHQATTYTCKQQGVSLELPIYKVLAPGGTASNPEFTVSVFFEKKKIGTGTAGSIREARRRAAEEGLRSSFVRIPPSLKVLMEDSHKTEQ